MPLVSALRLAIENMPESMKVDSVRNFFKKQGVKDAEIDNSGVMAAEQFAENGRIRRDYLLNQEAARPDATRIESYGSAYSSYTVPGTVPETYQARVYKNPVISSGRNSGHFNGSENYFMHTRSDIVDAKEIDNLMSLESLFNNGTVAGQNLAISAENTVRPTHGDRALRIQEIQSDLANQDIAQATDKTLYRHRQSMSTEMFSHVMQTEFFPYVHRTQGIKLPNHMNLLDSLVYIEDSKPIFTQFLKDQYKLNDEAAQRVLDEYVNLPAGNITTHRFELFNKLPEQYHDMSYGDFEDEAQEYLDMKYLSEADLRNGKSAEVDVETILREEPAELIPFLQEKYGVSTPQAVAITEMLDDMRTDLDPDRIGLPNMRFNMQDVSRIGIDDVEDEKLFDYPYVKQALYHELDIAQQQGIQEVQIAINPVGAQRLHRSPGVQRDHYEKTVKSTAEKVARQIGGTVEMKKGWLIIGLPAAGFTLPLYAQQSNEDKDASFITTATELGYSEEEARQTLFTQRAKEAGYTDEEIQQHLAAQQEQQAEQQMPEEEREMTWGELQASRDMLSGSSTNITNPDGTLNPSFNAMGAAIEQGQRVGLDRKVQSARSYISDIQESFQVVRPYLEITSMWNQDQMARLEVFNQELANQVTTLAQERGIDITYEDGLYYVTDQNGQKVEASPTMMQQLYGDKFETGGALAGAVAGGRAGLALGKHWITAAIGAVAGSAVGSVVGSELDYVNAAMSTRQSLDGRLAYEKAIGAAQASLTYDAIFGAGAIAAKGLAWIGGKTWRTLNTAYNMAKDGNVQGAYDALKSQLSIDDTRAQEVVQLWEKINGMDVPTGATLQEKALTILATTESGGESILRQVAATNPRASAAIRQEVNQRAQTLLDESNSVADDGAAVRVLSSLRSYVDDTKLYLDTVKQEFVNNTLVEMGEKVDYTNQISSVFDTIMDFTSIDANSMDFLMDRMKRTQDRARNIVEPGDLLEFRSSLNSLKYSRSITNTVALNKIDELLGTVDGQIESIAIKSLGETEGREWLDQWEEARESYSHMLIVQQNGLFNALTKETTSGKPITAATVARSLVRYGPSIDDAYIRRGGEAVNTYEEIIDLLPVSTVRDVEGIMVQELVAKYTAGNQGGLRATHFPSLAEALSVYPFRTAEAQNIKEVVTQLGQLYKNDAAIAQATGGITMEAFQSYLTTNPIARAQYSIASEVFNYAQQMTGGSRSSTRALINRVAEFLDKPLNPRTTSHLLTEVKENQRLSASIREFQNTLAAARADGSADQWARVRVYADSRGSFYAKPGQGRRPVESLMGGHIAREDHVRDVLQVQNIEEMSRFEKAKVIDAGYQAVMLADGRIIKLF
jgi:hypothetical protein